MGRKKKPNRKSFPLKDSISHEHLAKRVTKAAVLFYLVILIYLPAIWDRQVEGGGYIYDDDQLLTQNIAIRRGNGFSDPESWRGLAAIWYPVDKNVSQDYFPVTSTFFWLEWRLWGNNEKGTPPAAQGIGAPGYHIVNIVLHAGCALLLWMVLAQIGVPGAWVAALVWAVHPVCVESAAWISELKNTLSMFLFLLTMLAWFKFQKTRRKWDYALTFILFTVALLAKSAIVMAPFVLLLYVWWKRDSAVPQSRSLLKNPHQLSKTCRRFFQQTASRFFGHSFNWRSRLTLSDLLQSVPFFVLSLAFGVVTLYFQNTRAIGKELVPIGGAFDRLAGACFALGFYFYKTVLPFHLILIYPKWHETLPKIVQWLPALPFVALFYWAWRKRESWGRHLIFGLGFFVLMLFPILGFAKMSYMRLTLVADHFQYTPMVGVIALGVAGLAQWQEHLQTTGKQWLKVAAACVIVLFCALTWQRAYVFSDAELIWRDTLAKNPDDWQAHNHLGALLYGREKIDAALEHFKRAVELKPYLFEVRNNLGLALRIKGRWDEALEQYKRAVEIDPEQPAVRRNYADTLMMTKHYAEASEQYREAAKLNPGDPSIQVNMGASLMAVGKIDGAIACFREALRLAPDDLDAQRGLDVLLQKKREFERNRTEPPKGIPPAK